MHKSTSSGDLQYSTTRLASSTEPAIWKKCGDRPDRLPALPEGKCRQGEGGLRTKQLYKHSYRNVSGTWYFHDIEEQTVPVDKETSEKIEQYISSLGDAGKEVKELPLISIITVVFNGERHLEECIRSVLNQTYSNVEHIIIDGGSTDGTLDVIKEYEDSIDYWISEPDKGIYDAMNKGIQLSTGRLIGILNSDDWYEEDALEKACKYFNLHDDGDVYYGDNKIYSEGRKLLFYRKAEDVCRMDENKICCHQNAFVSADAYKRLGLYDLKYKIAADYDLMFRFVVNNCKFYRIDDSVVNYRLGGASSRSVLRGRREEMDIKMNYGVSSFKAGFSFARAFLRLAIRKILKLEEDSMLIKLYLKLFSPSTKPVEHRKGRK